MFLVLIIQKQHAWFQAPDGNWELARIISVTGDESLISFAEGKVSDLMDF